MPSLLDAPSEIEARIGTPSARPWAGLLLWAAVLLAGGYLLFAHGCHSHRDTELRYNEMGPINAE